MRTSQSRSDNENKTRKVTIKKGDETASYEVNGTTEENEEEYKTNTKHKKHLTPSFSENHPKIGVLFYFEKLHKIEYFYNYNTLKLHLKFQVFII